MFFVTTHLFDVNPVHGVVENLTPDSSYSRMQILIG